MDTPDLMTTEEVAEVTRTSESTLRYWRHLGNDQGPRSFKVGRRVLYKRADVEAWIDAKYAASA